MHLYPVIQHLLYVVPRQFKRRPAEREQQAKAVGNKDHFIKNIPICIYFFKAVALSMSTAVQSLLLFLFLPRRAPFFLATQACGHSKLLLWHLCKL